MEQSTRKAHRFEIIELKKKKRKKSIVAKESDQIFNTLFKGAVARVRVEDR